MGAKVILILLLHTQYSYSTPPRNYEFGLNVKEASYYIKTYDFPQDPRLYREYSSARVRNSLFGYGWCSFLDVKIDLDSKPRFYDCREGYTNVTVSKKGDKYYVKDMIFNEKGQLESIVASGNPQANGNREIQFNSTNESQHNYKIIYKGITPRRVLKDEGSFLFLTIDPKTNFIIKTSQHSKTHSHIVTQVNKTDHITKISEHKNTAPKAKPEQSPSQRHYHYNNHLLTWVRSSETGTVTYTYNYMMNMTQIRTSNGYTEDIAYHNNRDQAISRIWDQCKTKIKYKEEKDHIALARIQRKCGKQKPQTSVYKFEYKTAGLKSLEVRTPTSSMKIDYDPKTKKILKMRRNHGEVHTIHTGER